LEFSGYISYVGRCEEGEACGLGEGGRLPKIFVGEPAAFGINYATGGKAGLEPDGFGVKRLRVVEDSGKLR
jgi:hypothetical protein